MRYWAFGRLCTFALTVRNLAAPASFRFGLVLMAMRSWPANAQEAPMSAVASHLPPFAAGGTFSMRLVARMGQCTLNAIRAWRARTRQRRELLMLSDVELRELSLTEADVNREAGKPFWEGIQLTNH